MSPPARCCRREETPPQSGGGGFQLALGGLGKRLSEPGQIPVHLDQTPTLPADGAMGFQVLLIGRGQLPREAGFEQAFHSLTVAHDSGSPEWTRARRSLRRLRSSVLRAVSSLQLSTAAMSRVDISWK